MATYKLIPSEWAYSGTLTNPSDAFTDTDSTTYAELDFGTRFGSAYLGGFDFSVIPSAERIIGMTVAVKYVRYSSSDTGRDATLMSSQGGVALSNTVTDPSIATRREFTLTSDIEAILLYKDTLCIEFSCALYSPTSRVYGAEIIVETVPVVPNKIIYGNETLINLTSDTATEADVAVGKIFHLPSGVQATGALSPSVATATTSSSTARTVSFTVSKEPSWFMMIYASSSSVGRSDRVQHMIYDGTTTTTYFGYGSTGGALVVSTSSGSFSYSSGTLTITVKTTPYLGSGNWKLYYL